MAKYIVLWISQRMVSIVSVTDGVEAIAHIEPNARRQVGESPGHRLGEYYREVVDSIRDAENIFVFGSARAKMELKSEILKVGTLSHRVVGTETADAMTDTQLLAKAREICGLTSA
jgi:hypothetical protein